MNMKLLRNSETIGYSMIGASLAVIALIIVLMSGQQLREEEREIRAQGLSLLRVLAQIPLTELAPANGHGQILDVMRFSQNNPNFAYGVVVGPDGSSLAEVTAPATIVPQSALPPDPNAWRGERQSEITDSGRSIIEFFAPLTAAENPTGYIRLGYFKPNFSWNSQRVQFFATLALPIFLLTPMFYFLVKREIKPIRQATETMERFMSGNGAATQVQLTASGELRDFVQRFNQFVAQSQHRVRELESDQAGLLTSVKLLSYKQNRIDALLQSLPEAVMILDETGVINFVNAKVAPLFGFNDADIQGQRPEEWCNNPEVRAFLERFGRQGMAGSAVQSIEFTPSHLPQTAIGVFAYPLFSPKNADRLLGTLVIFRDISEEKFIKQSRAEFIAQVAHELKTPLNTLAMYSEVLMGPDGSDEQLRVESVNVIQDEVERLSALISNLLNITKIEMNGLKLDLQRVRILDFVQDIYQNLTASSRAKGIDFSLDAPREMGSVYLDKDLLRIAINNLLTNAIKYNRPNGAVTLSVYEDDQSLRIAVKDNGYGIAPEDQERIFDKFYRSSRDEVREQMGHGLGLPLARQIVQLHHGDLTLESTLGKGSVFEIRLAKELISRKPSNAQSSVLESAA